MIRLILSWLLIILCALFCVWETCHADVVVIYDKQTKEIYTISEKDDTILPEGKEKVILPGSFENYPLQDSATNYLYKNSKFIKNITKIDAEAQEKEAAEQKKIKEAQDKITAKDKLKTLGLTEDEVNLIIK